MKFSSGATVSLIHVNTNHSTRAAFQDSRPPTFHPSRIPGSRLSGFHPSSLLGFQPSTLPGFQPSTLPGFQVPGFQASTLPGFQPSCCWTPPSFPPSRLAGDTAVGRGGSGALSYLGCSSGNWSSEQRSRGPSCSRSLVHAAPRSRSHTKALPHRHLLPALCHKSELSNRFYSWE